MINLNLPNSPSFSHTITVIYDPQPNPTQRHYVP